MKDIKTNWTQDEFKDDVLLYAAKCEHFMMLKRILRIK